MADTFDPTGWTAALLGLFAVFAAIGALRQPGNWRTMIDEIDGSPALQVIGGLLELFLGAAIYLVNPWDPVDILSCIMKTVGGLMMFEALAIMAFSDIYFPLWLKNLAAMHRGWALVTLVLGAAMAIAGFARFA